MEKEILALSKLPAFQKLKAYYGQSTMFSVLRVERSENRHSAFLAWLFNPESSHGLQDTPLRKFLALAAAHALDSDKCGDQAFRYHLLAEDYSLEVEQLTPEQSIIGIAKDRTSNPGNVLEGIVQKTDKQKAFKTGDQNRFDIWALLRITYKVDNDADSTWIVPLVIENKIYSPEGDVRNDDINKTQTGRYKKAIDQLRDILNPDGLNFQPILVYLSPSRIDSTADSKSSPRSRAFIPLSYQDLLDYVIQPSSLLLAQQNAPGETRSMLDSYIRNLSWPSNRDGEQKREDYSILAIPDAESTNLKSIYDTQAFKATLCAIYPKQAKSLLGDSGFIKTEDQALKPLFENLWNANQELFKIVLYSQFHEEKKKMEVAQTIIKTNNRDNTRYWVGRKQGDWVKEKPLSKSEASFQIFKLFCTDWKPKKPGDTLTIDLLRNEFEGGLNSYYARYFQYLFYDFQEVVKYDVDANEKAFDKEVIKGANNWDFYWDDQHVLPIDGEVRSVIMWRKDDFENLIKAAAKKGIIVEPAK